MLSRNLRFLTYTATVGSLLAAASLVATTVQAQETKASTADVKTLGALKATAEEEVAVTARHSSTATKTDAPLRDVPQTINVISGELLRDQGALSMEAALRNVPGVSASSGDGQRDQVFIRGFSAIADQFVDGPAWKASRYSKVPLLCCTDAALPAA
jgi:catecholate siderophore receptor